MKQEISIGKNYETLSLIEKAAREKELLSHQHLITTVEEFKKAVKDINSEDSTASRKKSNRWPLYEYKLT